MENKTSSLVYRSAIIAALGGLLFGFDTVVISGTVKSLESIFQLDKWWLGFTVAIALFGTILGAATAQIPSNRLGRKPALILMAVLYFVSAVGSAYPELLSFGNDGYLWYSFLFFRFLGGIGVGAASVVSPLYTAEISPAKNRGFLVGLTQFNIVFGILVAYISNFVVASLNLGENAWRWMFAVEAVPAAAFFFLLFLTPESPRWLITKGRVEKAKRILDRLGTDSGSVDEEVKIIQNAIQAEAGDGKEVFFSRRLMFPIMLAICVAAFNQLSGINAILYYAPSIFEMAGADAKTAMFLPMIIGLTNLVFTMAALAVVDKFGRRTLLIIGSIGYITSMAIVATTFSTYATQFNVSTANHEVATQIRAVADTMQQLKDVKEAETPDPQLVEFYQAKLDKIRSGLKDEIQNAQNAAAAYAPTTSKETPAPAETVVNPENLAKVDGRLEDASDDELHHEKQSEAKPLQAIMDDELKICMEAIEQMNPELGKEIRTELGDLDLQPVVPLTGILTVLGGLMFFIASHAFGSGAIIWTFIGEIFPNRVRAQGQALGSFVHWILCAAVSQLFPPLLQILGPTTIFYGFSGLMVLQLLWSIFIMPETKQISLEEMQKKLGITK